MRSGIWRLYIALLLVLVVLGCTPQAERGADTNSAVAPAAFLAPVVHGVAKGVEAVGVLVVVGGAALATVVFLREWVGERVFADVYRSYRERLGQAILLGLEFLVAADIIGTVAVDPTIRNVGILGAIVVIRTFLSFALEVEIEGHWPWQSRHD